MVIWSIARHVKSSSPQSIASSRRLKIVEKLRAACRTDVQLEDLLAGIFQSLVVHLHVRGDAKTTVFSCTADDVEELRR